MDTMIQCIIHLPGSEPKKALLLFREGTRSTKIKRTRHSNKAGREKVAAQIPDEQFDKRCRQIARDELTRVRLSDEYQDGMRGVARYEARQQIVKVLEQAAALEEEAGQ